MLKAALSKTVSVVPSTAQNKAILTVAAALCCSKTKKNFRRYATINNLEEEVKSAFSSNQTPEQIQGQLEQLAFTSVPQIIHAWERSIDECATKPSSDVAKTVNATFVDKILMLVWKYQHSNTFSEQQSEKLEVHAVPLESPYDVLDRLQTEEANATLPKQKEQTVNKYAALLVSCLAQREYQGAIETVQSLCKFFEKYSASRTGAPAAATASSVSTSPENVQTNQQEPTTPVQHPIPSVNTSTSTSVAAPLIEDMANEDPLAMMLSGEHDSFIDQEFEKNFVGMHGVRDKLKAFMHGAVMDRVRLQRGLITEEHLSELGLNNMHVAFLGNPGTGKTSVARTYAHLLHKMGFLEKPNFHEVQREQLVGQYIGETEHIMKDFIQRAKGSVVFVDEAYRLVSPMRSDRFAANGPYVSRDFGIAVLETLLGEMTKKYKNPEKERIIFIFAGYPEPMKDFLAYNPGMRRRIGFVLQFPDLTAFELQQIFLKKAEKYRFRVDKETEKNMVFLLLEYFTFDQMKNVNAGLAERLFELAKEKQSHRLRKMIGTSFSHHHFTNQELLTLSEDDIRQAAITLKAQYEAMEHSH